MYKILLLLSTAAFAIPIGPCFDSCLRNLNYLYNRNFYNTVSESY
jgi:hypothetical protein